MSIQSNNPIRPTTTPSPTPSVTSVSAPQTTAPTAPPQQASQSQQVDAPQTRARSVGNDLSEIQGAIRSSRPMDLSARITALQNTSFANSASKFFHKLFGSETYSNYRSEKAALRAMNTLQNEARALATTGGTDNVRLAESKMKKAACWESALGLVGAKPHGPHTQAQTTLINSLSSSDQGREVLKEMGIFNKDQLEAYNVVRRCATQTSDSSVMSVLTQRNDDAGALRYFYEKKEFSPENSGFLEAAQRLMSGSNPPTMAQLRTIFQERIEGGDNFSGFHEEDRTAIPKINLPADILGPLTQAIQSGDYTQALGHFSRAVRNINDLCQNDSFNRFQAIRQGQPEAYQALVAEARLHYVNQGLAQSGLPTFS